MDLCGHKLKLKINEYIFSRFFENEPSEIWRHLSEKNQKTGFLRPISCKITLKKKKEQGGRKEAKRNKQTLVLAGKKFCLTEEVYVVLTFSIIQLDIYICLNSLKRGNCGLKNFRGLAVVVSIGRKPRDNPKSEWRP